MLARQPRRMTADQFLALYEGVEGRYELVDGEVVAMTGGSASHARLARRTITALDNRLSGTGCEPFGSDIGLLVSDDQVRFPDVAIYCDPRDLRDEQDDRLAYRYPKVVMEVLSSSTARNDRGDKLAEYKAVDSLMAIVLIDPRSRRIELHERMSPVEWRHLILPPESGVTLRDPAVTLAFADIFAAD